MAENTKTSTRTFRHRGRFTQVPIYFMKLIRMFIYQNDWIVLPLSAIIAAMVAMVIRHGFAVNMDGTLKGAFALSCVAIWNGCFNSIQVVCRERNIIKREHRSGMHISSYLCAHMLYQAILCLIQTGLTMGILKFSGVQLDGSGIITNWMIVDVGISIFIITYAADLLSLMISCFVHNTTSAMTNMPFILIFQLVFSGGIFTSLPGWANIFSNFTLSKYGLNCIAAQAHYNDLPMSLGWQLIDKTRDQVVLTPKSLDELLDLLDLPEYKMILSDEQLNTQVTGSITVNDIVEAIGEDKVKEEVNTKIAEASYNPNFESSKLNVAISWLFLIANGIAYMYLAIIFLEFIDKDKR